MGSIATSSEGNEVTAIDNGVKATRCFGGWKIMTLDAQSGWLAAKTCLTHPPAPV